MAYEDEEGEEAVKWHNHNYDNSINKSSQSADIKQRDISLLN